jgi:hypothetical protein
MRQEAAELLAMQGVSGKHGLLSIPPSPASSVPKLLNDLRARNRVKCVYADIQGVSAIDEFRSLRKRLRSVESLIVAGAAKAAGPSLPTSGRASPDKPENPTTLLARLAASGAGPSLGDEVCQLMQSKPGEVYASCQIYFQNVHMWMPIISQNLFSRRMTEFAKTRRSDFSLLFLSICLSIHLPTSDVAQEPLYQIIKAEYWRAYASVEASIEMVQAGLLLAFYEYASGMTEAAYHTIGTCARMGYWMELHKREFPSTYSNVTDAWLESAERYNIWCAIFIRDRCASTSQDRLLGIT